MSKFDSCLTSLDLRDSVPVDAMQAAARQYQEQQGMTPSAAFLRAAEEQLQLAQMEQAGIVKAVRAQWEAQGGAPRPEPVAEQAADQPAAEPKPAPVEEAPAPIEGDLRASMADARAPQESAIQKRVREVLYDGQDTVLGDDGSLSVSMEDMEGRLTDAEYEARTGGSWQDSMRVPLSEADTARALARVNGMTWHHGSAVTDLDALELRSNGGLFLADDVRAQHYAGAGGRVYEVPVQIKRPFFVENSDVTADMESSGELAKLKKAGFDAIVPLDYQDIVIVDDSALVRNDLRASLTDMRTIEVDGQRRPIRNSAGELVAPDFMGQVEFWKNYAGPVDERGRPVVEPKPNAVIDAGSGPIDMQIAAMVSSKTMGEDMTADEVLAFIESESSNEEYRELATALRKQKLKTKVQYSQVSPDKQFTVEVVNPDEINAAYEPGTDTAFLYKTQGAEQSLLHELVHAATLRALSRGGLAARKIRELHSQIRSLPNFADFYGTSNPEEFIAEAMTSPKFRQQLSATPAPGTVKRSIWQRFVTAVRSILGLPASSESILDRIMSITPDLMAENHARGSIANSDGLRASMASSIGDGIRAASLEGAWKASKNRLADFRNVGLQFLGRRQLVDLYANLFKSGTKESTLKRYSDLMQQMDADKNESGAEADGIADRWGKLKDADQLADLMHDSTLAQIDPSKDFIPGDNRTEHAALQRRLKALSPEAQTLYTEARDAYAKHWNKVRSEIRSRIARAMPESPRRAALLEQMDATFYEKVKGVYFPLARFGDYVVTVTGKNGERLSVNFAETLNEADALRAALLKKFPANGGYQVSKVTKKKEFNAGRDAVSRGFMQELFGVLDQYDSGGQLQDDINQLYLQSMPDLSWAKHGIHRKGTPGFSQDARRAFAQNMFHGARYLAKLRYGDRLTDYLDEMQDHVDAKAPDADYDSVKAQQVVDEMVKRHESYMNPQSSQLSNTLTSVGFLFYLGLSPASAVVNLTQTPLVTLPMLAAKYGFGKASAALLAAAQQTAANKNDISKVLQGDELKAFKQAVDAGVIDVSMAHDLAGIASGDDTKAHAKLRPVMKWASFMFHHGEKFNRQASLLAAYRLAREAGRDHAQAYESAVDEVYKSHFDYSSGNRARVMQGPVARVVLLFKQYSQNMIYTLTRNAVLAAKGDKVALKTLSGLLLSHAMAAGVLGLPIVGTLLSAATMLGGDDDEPWDAKVALRNYIADLIGQKPAEMLMHGLSRGTPFDISGRVGLDKLILPDVQEGLEGARLAESWMTAALGPVAGIGLGAAKGAAKIAEGDYLRGLEDMLPVSVRNPIKALRLNSEGVKDRSGIPILDDTSAIEEIGQLIGFSPSRSREAMEGKSAVYQAERKLTDRRQALVEQWAHAKMAGDKEGEAEVREQVEAFNSKNPGRRISPAQVMQSVRNRNKRIREAEDGIYLPKKHADVRDLGRFATAGD